MKIYLLDRKHNMVKCWKKYFVGMDDVEVVFNDFANFMEEYVVECIVSPANSFGLMDGGYDLAITKWFGDGLMRKVQKYIVENFNGEQPVATSFLIDIGYKNIKLIHTPTMREPEAIKEPLVIYQCMRTTLLEAIKNNINSIVIPAFGGGCGSLDYDLIARMMYRGFCQIMENKTAQITWENHLSNREIYRNIQVKSKEWCSFEKHPFFSIKIGKITNNIIEYEDQVIVLSNEEIQNYQDTNAKINTILVNWPRVYDYSQDQYRYAEELLLEKYNNILRHAYEQGYESILMQCLNTTIYGFKHEFIGKKVSCLINEFLFSLESELAPGEEFKITLIVDDEDIKKCYEL